MVAAFGSDRGIVQQFVDESHEHQLLRPAEARYHDHRADNRGYVVEIDVTAARPSSAVRNPLVAGAHCAAVGPAGRSPHVSWIAANVSICPVASRETAGLLLGYSVSSGVDASIVSLRAQTILMRSIPPSSRPMEVLAK